MKAKPIQEAVLFFGIPLGISYFIAWGPLAVFQIPAISFVENSRGPGWAIALYVLGGFVPSLVALALTGLHEGRAGMRSIVFFHWIYTYAAQVVGSGVTRKLLYNWIEYTPNILAAMVVAASWINKSVTKGKLQTISSQG